MIDVDHDDHIRPSELRDFFAQNGFYATEREILGLMYRFDPGRTDKINFRQFCDGLSP